MKYNTYFHCKQQQLRHIYHNLHTNIQKDKIAALKIILPLLFVICYLIYAICAIFVSKNGTKAQTAIPISTIQQGIADEIIRFHVIGNSNSAKDQAVKLLVKEAIVEELKPYLSTVTSKEEAKACITAHLSEIEETAIDVLSKNGFSYGATANLTYSTFPIKSYGDITLPPGEYEALRVELGSASGKNWWCIMFPQLCFVDSTYNVVPDTSKEQLQYLLTDDEYDAIIQDDTKVVVKFKLFDWVKKLFD